MAQTVDSEELKKAIEYLGLDPESFEKGFSTAPVKTIEGTDANGGDSGSNELKAKADNLTWRIQKAEADYSEMTKACSDMGAKITQMKDWKEKLEKGEDVGDIGEEKEDEEEDKTEPIEKSETTEPLEKSTEVSQLTKLVVSMINNQSKLEDLIKSNQAEIEKIGNQPVPRRSADNLSALQKSFGYDPLDESNKNKLSAKMQKSQVTDAMFRVWEKGERKDDALANAITTYEASGQLDVNTVNFMKSQGVEIVL